jgi:hypothetical protein
MRGRRMSTSTPTGAIVLQYLTAFDMPGPEGERTTQVLQDEGTRKLVAFHSQVAGLFGRKRRVLTKEWVTLDEPGLISFESVTGPLPLLRDRLELTDHGGCTVLRYHSTIGAYAGILGWPVAVLYAKPIVARHMREHMTDLKETIEARARLSRAYPQEVCAHDAALHPVEVV